MLPEGSSTRGGASQGGRRPSCRALLRAVPVESEGHEAMRRFLGLLEVEHFVRRPSEGVANVGYANHESPHSNPIALLPDGSLAYVANTPADTVDVIDTGTGDVVARVRVGIDPVGIAVRPDGCGTPRGALATVPRKHRAALASVRLCA